MRRDERLMSPQESDRSHVRRVQEDSRRHADLQGRVMEKLHGLVLSLEAERDRLHAEVKALRGLLQGRDEEHSRPLPDVDAIVDENWRLTRRCVQVERQSANLASLVTASLRLHDSLDREEILKAIEEIVASFIGCEEMAILEVDREAGQLTRIGSLGLADGRLRSVPLEAGLIGRAVATGETYVANGKRADVDPTPDEADLTACIPLKVGGKVTGAVVLYRLLSHKLDLEEADHELFDLLSAQAATALYCAELHAREEG